MSNTRICLPKRFSQTPSEGGMTIVWTCGHMARYPDTPITAAMMTAAKSSLQSVISLETRKMVQVVMGVNACTKPVDDTVSMPYKMPYGFVPLHSNCMASVIGYGKNGKLPPLTVRRIVFHQSISRLPFVKPTVPEPCNKLHGYTAKTLRSTASRH